MIPALANFHPIVIEGMGWYDPRNPNDVASQIVKQLESRFGDEAVACAKTKLLVTQGDPLSERGISAITPLVADKLGIQRGLVTLDPHIDPDHSANAPRDNVVVELNYSELVSALDDRLAGEESWKYDGSATARLERRVDEYLAKKNERRLDIGRPPLKGYFKDYAMLQEVTKAACRAVCGDITVVHTAATISEFSVTSFYEVGLELGFLNKSHYVGYGLVEELDFDKIDKR